LFAKSWAAAFPELPGSRAIVARLEREKVVYEDALRSGRAESARLQVLLIAAVMSDNAAAFAATLGARSPRLYILQFLCPDLSVWEVLNSDRVTLVNFVFAMGARAITRLLLGFFEVVPSADSLPCALASRDEELIREIWVHTPDEVRTRFVGSSIAAAAAFQLEVPFHWLLGLAGDADLDEAVEVMVENRLVGALCEVEATGFDLTRTRPARALAHWSRTVSTVTIPTPSLPSVPASTFLAWHVRELRDWDIPCDEPKSLASGGTLWGGSLPGSDFSSLMRAPPERVLFLGQTPEGVVFGGFANCRLSRVVRVEDPSLRSAIFVLEHPTGRQRKWQLRNPSYDATVDEECMWLGVGLLICAVGGLLIGSAPEFGMTEVDASFVSLKPCASDGWSLAGIDRWELWSV
jgi:hypothetical protein